MSDILGQADSRQALHPKIGREYRCIHCGGITRPMAILSLRNGTQFRLTRCGGCEKLRWAEEGLKPLRPVKPQKPAAASPGSTPRRS
jgi:hypothetical protein